jgi:Holliday junction resolvasome RuvABC endonuclease subunit
MIVGINATKGAVFVVQGNQDGAEFAVTEELRLQYAFSSARNLLDLMNSLNTIFERLGPGDQVAILKCSAGQYGSSVQAIKAETVAELAAVQKEIKVLEIAPQSLKKIFDCPGKDWRKAAQEMFNSEGLHKYWAQGMNGAFSAAYAASKL